MKNIKEMDVYSEEFLLLFHAMLKRKQNRLKHLQDTGQGFCFTERGVVSIEDAIKLSNPF